MTSFAAARDLFYVTNNQGFGAYSLPEGYTVSQFRTEQVVHAVARGLFGVIAAYLGAAALIAWGSSVLVLGAGGATLMASSFWIAKELCVLIGIMHQTAPTNELFAQQERLVAPLGGRSLEKDVTGFPTEDGISSHQWKLALMGAAQSSIVFSGCYCGGAAFEEVLNVLDGCMRRNNQLHVTGIATNIKLTPENCVHMQQLKEEFPDQLQWVVHPEAALYLSPTTQQLHLMANHVKALVIDGGRYFLIGGSGMVNTWARNVGEATPTEPLENLGYLYSWMGPSAFRDNDFVFFSPDSQGVGRRFYMELMKLSTHLDPQYRIAPLAEERCALSHCEEYHRASSSHVSLTPFATGPERTTNAYLAEMLRAIEGAQERIVIDHMYFHPNPPLFEALVRAAQRGVQITIVTNKTGAESPGSHRLYCALSRMRAKQLMCRVGEAGRVEWREYSVPRSTLHKKLLLIDQQMMFLGSANLGYKSLEGQSDYEMNLKVESAAFQALAWPAIQKDLEVSSEPVSMDRARHISIWQSLIAGMQQSCFTPFL